MLTQEQLEREVSRLESHQCCRNAAGRFFHWKAAGRRTECRSLWANREDIYYLGPTGAFWGKDACAEAVREADIVELDTETLVIAEDNCTARGVWNAPGADPDRESWQWGRVEMLFLQDGGAWRIWRMAYYPIFKTPMDRPWTETRWAIVPTGKEIDCQWNPAQPHPADRPEAPVPYRSELELAGQTILL